jgi:lysophospholipase L1-like esterase
MSKLAYKLAYAFATLALAACASLPSEGSHRAASAGTALAGVAPEPIRLDRLSPEIDAFEAADRAAPPPACADLFVGSSSIRFWRSLKEDFPARTVINRGFGGSTIAEVTYFFPRIVAPYKPRRIIFYAGENDLNSGVSPAGAFSDFQKFMALKSDALGPTPVWYISAKPSKLRLDQMPAQTDLNNRIKALASKRSDLAYIDVVGAMLKPDGTPKDIYVADNLHMTPDGYAIWTPLVERALAKGQRASAPGC